MGCSPCNIHTKIPKMETVGNQTNKKKDEKIMTMQKALHLREDDDKLYVSRNGGRGFATIEDYADASTPEITEYIE